MKRILAAVAAAAGTCTMAGAVVNTRIDFQLSADGVNWYQAFPLDIPPLGQTFAVRALVTYTGTASPVGLASLVFQPTMSNAVATDTFQPFVNGGVGGNTSTPPGVISGPQLFDMTSYGRVSPWGNSATTSTSAIRGFFHTNPNGDGINYLRIAQSQTTSWIGGAGNTSGGGGVRISQLSDAGRTTSDPPFNGSLTNVYVFKWGFTLGPGHTASPVFDAPLAGFGNVNTATGDREVYWYANSNDATGSIRGTAVVFPAYFAPSPASLSLLAFGAAAAERRRRPVWPCSPARTG